MLVLTQSESVLGPLHPALAVADLAGNHGRASLGDLNVLRAHAKVLLPARGAS